MHRWFISQVKCLLQKLLLSSEWKNICARFFNSPILLLMGRKNRPPKKLCGNTLKWNKLKVYISLKENKLECFTNR